MDYKQALVILGLTEGFTEDELKKKYRELSMKWHPDKGGNEEMMKQINVAYETLKSKTTKSTKETSNEQSNQYYEFKRKLEVYRSKKNYTPGTLEHKYAESVNKVINNYIIIYKYKPVSYFTCLEVITYLFLDYKNKVCKDIPKSFLEKYSNINEMCPFDEYVQRLEKIKNEYKKIETTLDDVIGSIDRLLSNEVYGKILETKNKIFKEVIDGKINLQDGAYKLHSLIMQIIAIQDKLQKSEDEELYITRDGKGKPEFVLKKSEDEEIVSFYRKKVYYDVTLIIEEYTLNRKEFYDKYISLNEYLANAKFVNKCVWLRKNMVDIELYNLGDISIYLGSYYGEQSIAPGYAHATPAPINYYTEKYGAKYKDKQVLIEEIYQSFKKNKEKHKEKTK